MVLLEEKGKLRGLVTVKDVLKYTARIENIDSPSMPHYSRACGGVFDKLSSWINKRQQPYTQLQSRSSIDVNVESHELDGRL